MIYLENEFEFENLIKDGIVLVDFYAEWCGPCKMLSPILDAIDYMKVVKVNTDKCPTVSMKLGVMSIPTLCFYKDGELVEKTIGFKTEDEIKQIYEKIK